MKAPWSQFTVEGLRNIDTKRYQLGTFLNIYYNKFYYIPLEGDLIFVHPDMTAFVSYPAIYASRSGHQLAYINSNGLTATFVCDYEKLNKWIAPWKISSREGILTLSNGKDERFFKLAHTYKTMGIIDEQAISMFKQLRKLTARYVDLLKDVRGSYDISMCKSCSRMETKHLIQHIERDEISPLIIERLTGWPANKELTSGDVEPVMALLKEVLDAVVVSPLMGGIEIEIGEGTRQFLHESGLHG